MAKSRLLCLLICDCHTVLCSWIPGTLGLRFPKVPHLKSHTVWAEKWLCKWVFLFFFPTFNGAAKKDEAPPKNPYGFIRASEYAWILALTCSQWQQTTPSPLALAQSRCTNEPLSAVGGDGAGATHFIEENHTEQCVSVFARLSPEQQI